MYESRAEVTATDVPAATNTLQVVGFLSGGDGGGALYCRLSPAPSPAKMWHLQSADGAWWQMPPDRRANVRRVGAVGDGNTDDTSAIVAAVEYLGMTGGTVYFPVGKYLISHTIDIDLSASISDTDGTTINIMGDGSGNTILVSKTETDAPIIRLRGARKNAGMHIWGRWSGFAIVGA